mgnify:FL=1
MSNEDCDWILRLDDTLRLLSQISESSGVGVAVDGVLPRIDIGYNEEFSIKNESKDTLYFVRGGSSRIIEVPPAPVRMVCYDTIGASDVSVCIRINHVNTRTPKLNSNMATQYSFNSRHLVQTSVFIPELGGFLCSLSQLSRVKNICRTRYQPISPDAACPVWIHAHMTDTHLTHLYASVNNRIVRIKVHRGRTDHAQNRLIYYQWAYSPDREVHESLDTIPMDHFAKNSMWETKYGEFVTTTYEELKVILERRGIDMDYIQMLKEECVKKDKDIAFFKSQMVKLADPLLQEDFISDKRRERIVKTVKDTLDVIDKAASTTKTGQDIHDKYLAGKRKRAEDSFFRIKQLVDSGSGIVRLLTGLVSLVGSAIKLFG